MVANLEQVQRGRGDTDALIKRRVACDLAIAAAQQELPADRAGACRYRVPSPEATGRGGSTDARPVRARLGAGLRSVSPANTRDADQRGPRAHRGVVPPEVSETRPGRLRLHVPVGDPLGQGRPQPDGQGSPADPEARPLHRGFYRRRGCRVDEPRASGRGADGGAVRRRAPQGRGQESPATALPARAPPACRRRRQGRKRQCDPDDAPAWHRPRRPVPHRRPRPRRSPVVRVRRQPAGPDDQNGRRRSAKGHSTTGGTAAWKPPASPRKLHTTRHTPRPTGSNGAATSRR